MVLRVIFRAVCRVFRVMWLFAERADMLACGQKKESTRRMAGTLCALRAVGYSARLLTLSLTSAVNSSKACIMSLSRIAITLVVQSPKKASRSAVESVWD